MPKDPNQNSNCPKWLSDLENLKEKRDQLSRAFKDATKPQGSPERTNLPSDQTGSSLVAATSIYQPFATCAALRAEIKPLLAALREAFPGLTKEEIKLVNQLEKDYHSSIETLKFYELLDAQNGTAYTSDYAEFKDRQFKVPTWPEIKKRLTKGPNRKEAKQKLAAILEMQKKGNKPRLYLTPIGKTIRSLAKAIDIKIQSKHTIGDEIKDSELEYFPQEIKVGPAPDFKITSGNSKTKAQVIRENNGFLITVAESKQELGTDPEVAGEENPDRHGLHGDSNWNKLSYSQKLARYLFFQQAHHQTGLTCEDYMVMEIGSLHSGFGQLDDFEERSSYLNGVSIVPCVNWQRGIFMYKPNFDNKSHRFRIRGAVRI